jgi:hypothetical protein
MMVKMGRINLFHDSGKRTVSKTSRMRVLINGPLWTAGQK